MKIEDIFQTVRARRKALGLDQIELARLSGISVHALINLEGGKGTPTLRTLIAVCDVLGLHVDVGLRKN